MDHPVDHEESARSRHCARAENCHCCWLLPLSRGFPTGAARLVVLIKPYRIPPIRLDDECSAAKELNN